MMNKAAALFFGIFLSFNCYASNGPDVLNCTGNVLDQGNAIPFQINEEYSNYSAVTFASRGLKFNNQELNFEGILNRVDNPSLGYRLEIKATYDYGKYNDTVKWSASTEWGKDTIYLPLYNSTTKIAEITCKVSPKSN